MQLPGSSEEMSTSREARARTSAAGFIAERNLTTSSRAVEALVGPREYDFSVAEIDRDVEYFRQKMAKHKVEGAVRGIRVPHARLVRDERLVVKIPE